MRQSAVTLDAFWAFSLHVYHQPGVSGECLHLQDEHGIDVNLLLFCAFAGAVHGAILPPPDIGAAKERVAAWHTGVVQPLRQARRALKSLKDGQDSEMLRAQVMAAELEAERCEQKILAEWAALRLQSWPRQECKNAVTQNIRALLPGGAPLPAQLVAAALALSR